MLIWHAVRRDDRHVGMPARELADLEALGEPRVARRDDHRQREAVEQGVDALVV